MKTSRSKQPRRQKFPCAQFTRCAATFATRNIKSIHWLILLMLPGLGWGACFSEKITELAASGKTYRATVLSNKRVSQGNCQLTVDIARTKITGTAEDPLCRAQARSTIYVQVHTSCCDKPPCDKNQQTKIWFTQPPKQMLSAQMARPPVMMQQQAQALSQGSITSSGAGVGSISKSQKAESKLTIIKNQAKVASSPSIALGQVLAVKPKNSQTPKNGTPPAEQLAMASAKVEAEETSKPLDEYKVELGVDGVMQLPGPPGELLVWIGDSKFSANFSDDMATTDTTIAAIGNSAKVTPYAPDFDISPTESICFIIDPSGSTAHFAISPRSTGTFKVGADVLLYASNECTGAPVPKSATTLKVEVVVNKEGVAKNHLLQLWDVLWKGILNFWTWLVATIFGLFVFLIRKRLKKWFGFEAPDSGSPDR